MRIVCGGQSPPKRNSQASLAIAHAYLIRIRELAHEKESESRLISKNETKDPFSKGETQREKERELKCGPKLRL